MAWQSDSSIEIDGVGSSPPSPSFLVSSLIFLCSTEKTKEREKTLVNFSSELGSSCVIIRFPIGSMIATKWANQSVYMPMQASKQEHLRIKILAWVPPGVTPFIKKKKEPTFSASQLSHVYVITYLTNPIPGFSTTSLTLLFSL